MANVKHSLLTDPHLHDPKGTNASGSALTLTGGVADDYKIEDSGNNSLFDIDSSVTDLLMSYGAGGTATHEFTLKDAVSGAFKVTDGTVDFIQIDTDGTEKITFTATDEIEFSVTQNSIGNKLTMDVPNVSSAFILKASANEYIRVDLVGGSENLRFGNTSDNPDYNFLGAGTVDIAGDLVVDGKLTVGGLIDPTGLVLDEQASVPAGPTAGKGTLWVRNDTPNVLVFTDDAGTDFDLGTGGGSLQDAYDASSPKRIQLDTSATGLLIERSSNGANYLVINTSSPQMTFGAGVENPIFDFQGTGAFRLNSTTGTSGQVITAGASGEATWADATGGGASNLQEAYDGAGSGAGRSISVFSNATPVEITGSSNGAILTLNTGDFTINGAVSDFDFNGGNLDLDPSGTVTCHMDSGQTVLFCTAENTDDAFRIERVKSAAVGDAFTINNSTDTIVLGAADTARHYRIINQIDNDAASAFVVEDSAGADYLTITTTSTNQIDYGTGTSPTHSFNGPLQHTTGGSAPTKHYGTGTATVAAGATSVILSLSLGSDRSRIKSIGATAVTDEVTPTFASWEVESKGFMNAGGATTFVDGSSADIVIPRVAKTSTSPENDEWQLYWRANNTSDNTELYFDGGTGSGYNISINFWYEYMDA